MKKALSLILALTIALSLAACGGKSTEGESTGSNDSTTPVEVTFWYAASGVLGEEIESIVEEYNNGRGAELGYHVTATYQGASPEGTNKQIRAYQTNDVNNACDVNIGVTSTLRQLLELDWNVPVEDAATRFGAYVPLDSFAQVFRNATTYQGKQIGLPFTNSTLLMYYNKDALAEAGYTEPPKTMDELVEYAKNLTVKDASGNVTRYGFECEFKRYQLTNLVVRQSDDAYFYDMADGRDGVITKVIASEEGTLKKALEKIDALVETGCYNYVEDSIIDEFANGKAAIIFASCSRCYSCYDTIGDKFDWETTMIPMVNEGDTGSSSVGGQCVELYNRGNDKRLEAAWDFAQYLVTPESSYRIGTHSGYVPVNKNVADTPEMKAFWEDHHQMKVPFNILMAAPANAQEPLEPVYNEANAAMTDAIRALCDRELTVDQAVEQIESNINTLLDDWHSAND